MNDDHVLTDTVPAVMDGERLDRFVSLMTGLSRSVVATVVTAGGVVIDGVTADVGRVRLVEGQVVTVDQSAVPVVGPPEADASIAIDVVHADEAIIVVDKAPGVVVHPGAGNPDGTLVNGLLHRFPDIADVGEAERPGIVHRLDAGSSGLLVVARTQGAYEALVAQFADHSAQRRYRALVWGHPTAPHGVIDAPIGRSRRDPTRMAVAADGRASRTRYRVVDIFDEPAELAVLECSLETGRTHQIRVHLSSIGHPLVGDPVYGQRRPVLQMTRPFLHAEHLELRHPLTSHIVGFDSPLAPDLLDMLTRCRRRPTDPVDSADTPGLSDGAQDQADDDGH